jgi:hypothetical protein
LKNYPAAPFFGSLLWRSKEMNKLFLVETRVEVSMDIKEEL